MLGLSTAVLLFAGLYFARSILAPVAFSLFVIAIVWPLQRTLETRVPRLLALVATLVVTLLVIAVLGYLIWPARVDTYSKVWMPLLGAGLALMIRSVGMQIYQGRMAKHRARAAAAHDDALVLEAVVAWAHPVLASRIVQTG